MKYTTPAFIQPCPAKCNSVGGCNACKISVPNKIMNTTDIEKIIEQKAGFYNRASDGMEVTAMRHTRQCNRELGNKTQDIQHATNITNARTKTMHGRQNPSGELTILTGGFPCQPFSQAGRRKGTSDDRYKWPEMFEVIKNIRPDWVVAENVRGLASWNDGMVLETVCTDLENQDYEVRPYIIPACSVGAPHKRERIWIVANLRCTNEQQRSETVRPKRILSESEDSKCFGGKWDRDWREVALATCYDGVDDGLPRKLDGATYRGKTTNHISSAQHRKERLKACGNAIVPQVAMQIFKAIKEATKENV